MSTAKPNILKNIKEGDIFSEISHYKVKSIGRVANNFDLEHLESGEVVSLSANYVQNLLTTADQFFEEKEVTKEDNKKGEPGIRTIWENIHSAKVFTVAFNKQDTPLSDTKLKTLREAQITDALVKIENAAKNKKGVANVAKTVLAEIQANPINAIIPGELRVLRGYKTQFTSRDGKYDVVDMDLVKDSNIITAMRQVNINTIVWLVVDGIRYIVK